MKQFEDFFTDIEILRYICKIRVKIAKTRNKKHLLNYLTSNPKYNYHIDGLDAQSAFEEYQIELNKFLSSILPSRKEWVKLGSISRQHPQNKKEFLTSNDKNFYSLLKTYKVHKAKNSTAEWFINLEKYISKIQNLVKDDSYKFSTPIIFPKLKEEKKNNIENQCRPICIFNLEDRIILSITNNFFTKLFDKYFEDCVFAFRSKKNSDKQTISHHDCIKKILEYRKENEGKQLFVVECDMKKFYDTVNHKIIIEKFESFITKVQLDCPDLNLRIPVKLFKNYLDCYAFNINVPQKSDINYWNSYRIKNGNFTWIDNSELELMYQDISRERIGVPQGGALSGLIANIYLTKADLMLKGLPILYLRFCDDMIIIADDLKHSETAKSLYLEALKDLKLFPHNFKTEDKLMEIEKNEINYKGFWNGKSKGPYQWGSIVEKKFPWIGFVGYEINYLGELRIRKKSFTKELKKQKKVIKEIDDAISTGMRKHKGTATESAINRLIGMSVGRIGIDNFDEVSTDMCWKNGFRELSLNKHSSKQIKELDRSRNKLYYDFIKNIKEPELDSTNLGTSKESKEIIKYNKPFSYYYQVLERQKKANS